MAVKMDLGVIGKIVHVTEQLTGVMVIVPHIFQMEVLQIAELRDTRVIPSAV